MAMKGRIFTRAPRARPTGRRIAAWAIALALVLGAVWGGGLFAFVGSIPRSPASGGDRVDAIVVLTGGAARLKTGLALIAEKRARKLFVSGVYRGVDVAELLRVSQQSPEDVACCIVLGYSAESTRGNAVETARWMAEEGFDSLRLVTANYHMPRSLIEFRAAMPEVRLVAHPVIPEHVKLDAWWRWPGTAALVVDEYNKYLFARLRSGLGDLARWVSAR